MDALDVFPPFLKDKWNCKRLSLIPSSELIMNLLRDGSALCRLMNIIIPQCIPSYDIDIDLRIDECVKNLQKVHCVCKTELKIKEKTLFNPLQIASCLKENLNELIETLLCVANYADAKDVTPTFKSIPIFSKNTLAESKGKFYLQCSMQKQSLCCPL
jgi:hypothetical protein